MAGHIAPFPKGLYTWAATRWWRITYCAVAIWIDRRAGRGAKQLAAGHGSATADASPAKHLMGRSDDRPAATIHWCDFRRLTP